MAVDQDLDFSKVDGVIVVYGVRRSKSLQGWHAIILLKEETSFTSVGTM